MKILASQNTFKVGDCVRVVGDEREHHLSGKRGVVLQAKAGNLCHVNLWMGRSYQVFEMAARLLELVP